MEVERLAEFLPHVGLGLDLFPGNPACQFPIVFPALQGLQPCDKAAHAVADQHHLVQGRFAMLRIEHLPHIGQVVAQLGRAEPERLAGGIEVEPELVVPANVGRASQVVEHLHPGHGARPHAVNEQDRDLARLVGLHHVQPFDHRLLIAVRDQQLLGLEEADRGQRLHGHLREEIGQRRRQVAFQRDEEAPHAGIVDLQGVAKLQEHLVAARRARSVVRPQEGGDREAQARRIVAGRLRLAPVAAADNDQRHAQPVGLIVVFESLHLVVGDELEVIEVVRLPDAAAEHAGDIPRAGRRVDGLGCARP